MRLLLLIAFGLLAVAAEDDDTTSEGGDDSAPADAPTDDASDASSDPFGAGAACTPYTCSSGSTPVPKTKLKLVSTGCENFGGMQMFSGMGGNQKGNNALGRWYVLQEKLLVTHTFSLHR